MFVIIYSSAVKGIEATTITIETNQTRGVMIKLSSMTDTAVKERYDRISAAWPNIGFMKPTANLTFH